MNRRGQCAAQQTFQIVNHPFAAALLRVHYVILQRSGDCFGVERAQKLLVIVLLALFCALCKPLIAVNYDMNDYLPPDTVSTLALDAMDAEYDGVVPNARVMVKNVTIPEALSYKRALAAVDGVTDVTAGRCGGYHAAAGNAGQ